MKNPARLAVLVSGGGTNLQSLLDHFNSPESPVARVTLVISNRASAGGLERARLAGVPTRVINPVQAGEEAAGAEMLEALNAAGIDMVALAGYLKLIPPAVVKAYTDRILNIHPALLPSFGGAGMYGARVHRAVIESGARVSGATVHLVDDHYDEGRILAQWPVPVLPGDTEETLGGRVLKVEHLLYPLAIERFLTGEGDAPVAPLEAFDLIADTRPPAESIGGLNYRIALNNR
ncbi:MAG: phosphoribosylglycinamide formyltransferase [Gemmatimonadota bacterium]|nr:phosphoribosylglycinamide formyltransferase [Gemmatimonadota bacterium]